MKEIKRNQFDKKDALEIGQRAESLFFDLAKEKGYGVVLATKEQDINEHWDCEISKDNERHKVDIKGRKRISRSDSKVQDEWIWVEIHGVRACDQGWLYGGKSDLIAFESEESFVIVKTADLRALIPKKLEKDTDMSANQEKPRYLWVKDSSKAQYKLYRRSGRKDILTLIQFSDLTTITWQIWQK